VTDRRQTEKEKPGWAWAPFRHRIFRAMWIAQFVGNLGTYAQTVGAQWLMGDLGGSALEVALIQTASSLPVFLLVIPAGAFGRMKKAIESGVAYVNVHTSQFPAGEIRGQIQVAP